MQLKDVANLRNKCPISLPKGAAIRTSLTFAIFQSRAVVAGPARMLYAGERLDGARDVFSAQIRRPAVTPNDDAPTAP